MWNRRSQSSVPPGDFHSDAIAVADLIASVDADAITIRCAVCARGYLKVTSWCAVLFDEADPSKYLLLPGRIVDHALKLAGASVLYGGHIYYEGPSTISATLVRSALKSFQYCLTEVDSIAFQTRPSSGITYPILRQSIAAPKCQQRSLMVIADDGWRLRMIVWNHRPSEIDVAFQGSLFEGMASHAHELWQALRLLTESKGDRVPLEGIAYRQLEASLEFDLAAIQKTALEHGVLTRTFAGDWSRFEEAPVCRKIEERRLLNDDDYPITTVAELSESISRKQAPPAGNVRINGVLEVTPDFTHVSDDSRSGHSLVIPGSTVYDALAQFDCGQVQLENGTSHVQSTVWLTLGRPVELASQLMLAAARRLSCRVQGSHPQYDGVMTINFPTRMRAPTTAHVLAESEHFSVVRFSGELLPSVVMTGWTLLLELHAIAQRLGNACGDSMLSKAAPPPGATKEAWKLKLQIEQLSTEFQDVIQQSVASK